MKADDAVKVVARRVTERIGELAPKGLGRWDGAWELVADPSDEFMDALAIWRTGDTEENRERVQRTADALVQAWAEAAAEWEARGRPTGGAGSRDEEAVHA